MPLPTIPYSLPEMTPEARLAAVREFTHKIRSRRSCRAFSDKPVPRELIESCVAAANLAPSGANRQPWCFVAVDDPTLKREIRTAAEAEERENYEHRFPDPWLAALEPLGTGPDKPYLEIAPWLVAVFCVNWDVIDGEKRKNYYVHESVGLAAGFFLVACHFAGLATLTHTPSPMTFLRDILGRPENEKPFLLIPVGYPADDARVPDITKKPVADVMLWNR